MAGDKRIVVLIETRGVKLTVGSLELLGLGRRLADDLEEELCAILIGHNVSHLGCEVIAYGADRVYVTEDPLLAEYQADSYLPIVQRICTTMGQADTLVMGHTSLGRDLAPRLAFRMDVSLSMDCTDLRVDPDSRQLLQTRPIYGGSVEAVYVADSRRPQIVTVRPKTASPLDRDAGRTGEIVPVDPEIDTSHIRTKVLERVTVQAEGMRLEEAKIIVSAGRGVGSVENVKTYIWELAGVLSAGVGGTRGAVDAGYVSQECQIGLTGKLVGPNLYIAIGISGAAQHLAGCLRSKRIVAINKDELAPIFGIAHYGIVGDYKAIVPALTRRVKELMAE